MLDVRGLKKVYEGSGRRVEAVRDLTFTVGAGELVCLVGPSGCGKTTLLKCVGGLLTPTGGEVLLEGRKVSGPPPGMAFVFQEYGRSLFPWMRVGENVELPLRQKDLGKARRRELVRDALESVGAGGRRGGVSLAAVRRYAAAGRHRPGAGVRAPRAADGRAVRGGGRADPGPIWRTWSWGLWRERGITILFVTHDIDEAVYLGERVIVLSASPTVVREQLKVHLPVERDQLHTRVDPRFAELRTHVYEQIQAAKKGVVAS
ncbi:NitT/TauT family transport system ATP-binding protein OS=Streptomyces violarus OX=67380 GN=FHS41_001626 PE=4 SV=1 [Streptomyces violarus]